MFVSSHLLLFLLVQNMFRMILLPHLAYTSSNPFSVSNHGQCLLDSWFPLRLKLSKIFNISEVLLRHKQTIKMNLFIKILLNDIFILISKSLNYHTRVMNCSIRRTFTCCLKLNNPHEYFFFLSL